VRHVEYVHIGITAGSAIRRPSLGRIAESGHQCSVGRDIVIAHAIRRELRGDLGRRRVAVHRNRHHRGCRRCRRHVYHRDMDRLLECRRWRGHRDGTTTHTLRHSGNGHHERETLRIGLWLIGTTGLSFTIGSGLLTLDALRTVNVIGVQCFMLFL